MPFSEVSAAGVHVHVHVCSRVHWSGQGPLLALLCRLHCWAAAGTNLTKLCQINPIRRGFFSDLASKTLCRAAGEVFDMESAAFQHVCATNQVDLLTSTAVSASWKTNSCCSLGRAHIACMQRHGCLASMHWVVHGSRTEWTRYGRPSCHFSPLAHPHTRCHAWSSAACPTTSPTWPAPTARPRPSPTCKQLWGCSSSTSPCGKDEISSRDYGN